MGKVAEQHVLTQCDKLRNDLWRCTLRFTPVKQVQRDPSLFVQVCLCASGATEAGEQTHYLLRFPHFFTGWSVKRRGKIVQWMWFSLHPGQPSLFTPQRLFRFSADLGQRPALCPGSQALALVCFTLLVFVCSGFIARTRVCLLRWAPGGGPMTLRI